MTATRVLLVEDEGLIRMVAAEVLQEEGFEVIEAWDGDEAARLLDSAEHFDLLFTDVQMPGLLDGIDVALHARRRYARLPILVVSGYAHQIVSRLAVLSPAAVFIRKPYRLQEIVDAVTRLLAVA